MPCIQGADRSQGLLLPGSLEDYVGPDHPARAIGSAKLKASNHPTRRADAARLARPIAAISARTTEYLAALEAGDQATGFDLSDLADLLKF